MTKALQLVVRNFLSLTGAEAVSRAIALVTIGYCARELQPAAFGYLGLSLAIMTYLGLLVALGLDQIGARQLARRPEDVSRYVTSIVVVRICSAAAVYVALAITVGLLPLDPLLKKVLWVDGLGLLGLAVSTTWALQGLQEMRVVAAARVMQSLVAAVLVLAFVRGPEGVVLVCLSNAVAGFVSSLMMVAVLRRITHFKLAARDRGFALGLVRKAVPFAVMTGLLQIYANCGLVLLGWWRPAAEVGLYSAAHRLTFGLLQQISIFLVVAFMPAITRAHYHEPGHLRGFHRNYSAVSIGFGACIVAVGLLFPTTLLSICFGEGYESAAGTLRLLSGAIGINFVSGPYVAALAATRFERELAWQSGFSAAVCLLMSVWLIPRSGGEGAALALLVGSAAGTALCVYLYHRNRALLEQTA